MGNTYWFPESRVQEVIKKYPEAREALRELFPEVREQHQVVVTEAYFLGEDIGGCSNELTLKENFFWPDGKLRRFSKITFEWEE